MRLFGVLALVLAACVLAGNGGAGTVKPSPASYAPHALSWYSNTPVKPRSLQAEARWVAAHGGIQGSCYACATPQLKSLVRALIRQVFRPAGWTAIGHALCYSRRESGWNPGAVSPTHDHSSFQVNAPSHPQFDYWRMDHDPAYGVEAGWIVSSHGTDWGPWSGGTRPC